MHTDGALAMVGKKDGGAELLKKYMDWNVFAYHCVIHQAVLFAKDVSFHVLLNLLCSALMKLRNVHSITKSFIHCLLVLRRTKSFCLTAALDGCWKGRCLKDFRNWNSSCWSFWMNVGSWKIKAGFVTWLSLWMLTVILTLTCHCRAENTVPQCCSVLLLVLKASLIHSWVVCFGKTQIIFFFCKNCSKVAILSFTLENVWMQFLHSN